MVASGRVLDTMAGMASLFDHEWTVTPSEFVDVTALKMQHALPGVSGADTQEARTVWTCRTVACLAAL
jgi:hypothetical protein